MLIKKDEDYANLRPFSDRFIILDPVFRKDLSAWKPKEQSSKTAEEGAINAGETNHDPGHGAYGNAPNDL